MDNYKTNLATLNFLTLSVNYQETLPLIWDMQTGVFVSASIYYTASNDMEFFKDYTTK